MANDWIKVRFDLLDDPAVIEMSALLDMEDYAVVGRLVKLWTWADKHTISGNAMSVTEKFLDRYVSAVGFADAMRKVGWLGGDDGSISFPNFDRHNGKTAKNRAQTNLRVAQHREQQNGNATVTKKALQKPLPEKRRSINTPLPPSLAEVTEFVRSKGLNESFARHYHETNTLGGWINSKGKPILVWKGNCNQWIENLDEAKRARYSLIVVNGATSIEEAQRLAR
jgi:hypothetical protein